ncbi:MAG: hypothetical protein LLG01_11810 [Planctomycetaceae bacterium]|nr:hypothetical protein [Planctomycetaceae bacterium]
MAESYETHAKGIRILPGMWRPHYAWEHIAWVSPPWPSQEYLWLDFPEAVFTDHGLLYLSHVNPPAFVVPYELPAVAWRKAEGGIEFDRELPIGLSVGGRLTLAAPGVVAMTLTFDNRGGERIGGIKLQTCAFLKAIKEFSEHTMANKFVHATGKGWMPWEAAQKLPGGAGGVMVGWHSGPDVLDMPLIVTRSSQEPRRLVAMTWFEHTESVTGNPGHPCMHADPNVPDLAPGAKAVLHGELMFFEGTLDAFEDFFKARQWAGSGGR